MGDARGKARSGRWVGVEGLALILFVLPRGRILVATLTCLPRALLRGGPEMIVHTCTSLSLGVGLLRVAVRV